MSLEFANLLAGLDIPESGCSVTAPRKYFLAVRREADRLNPSGMRLESTKFLPGLDIPEANGVVFVTVVRDWPRSAPSEHLLTVARECNRIDWVGMAFEFANLLASLEIPKACSVVGVSSAV